MNKVCYVVDLGTTMIDTCIIEKNSKKEVYRSSIKNPQSLYGADVMNRILTIQRDYSNLNKLSCLVKTAILEDLLKWFSINKIYKLNEVVIVGNTTMISILLCLDVTSMAAYPFKSPLKSSITIPFSKLMNGIAIFSRLKDFLDDTCDVFLSGCISAFLGGDVISGIEFIEQNIYNGFNEKQNQEPYLFLDLGTNGEMILYSETNYYGASTACGPAFEGCTRNQKVFGNTTLDAISLGRKLKLIDEFGTIVRGLTNDKLDVGGVHLDANILRQIMLAKSAIVAGYLCLIQQANMRIEDVKHLYIAGGFGFHMNIENAVFLGIIPKCLKQRVMLLGNTALAGGKDILFDKTLRNHFDVGLVKQIKIVDLTNEDTFKKMLIEQCKFTAF